MSGVEDRLSLLVRNSEELVDCGYYARVMQGRPAAPPGDELPWSVP